MDAAGRDIAGGVAILGGGLAGSLLALALRERGRAVRLIDAGGTCATALSYGVIPGWPLDPSPLGRLAAGAGRRWRELQRRHGDLGWRPRQRWPLPLSQVDSRRFWEVREGVLAAAGVERLGGRVTALEPLDRGWRLTLADGSSREEAQVVLAAGAGCGALRHGLPSGLGMSWAGVLTLPAGRGGEAYPLRLPTRFRRLALEARCATLDEPEWVVDAGLVPWGEGGLLGQLTWIAPAGEGGAPPDPQRAEGWLREALAGAPPPLGELAPASGRYQQVPVAFCRDGPPLAGELRGPGIPAGLWLFSGFRGAFAQVPVLAPLLAQALAPEDRGQHRDRGGPAAALAELGRLGVRPDLRASD